MVEVVLEGLGTPNNQLMPKGFFGWSAKVPARSPDPRRGKALLAEAGYPNGFMMDLYCTSDRLPGDGAICQGLGQMFAQIGVKTNVNAISRSVYFPAQAKKEYSIFMNGWGTLTGEGSYTLAAMAHSNSPELKLGAFNRIEYANPRVDELLQADSNFIIFGGKDLEEFVWKRRKPHNSLRAKGTRELQRHVVLSLRPEAKVGNT